MAATKRKDKLAVLFGRRGAEAKLAGLSKRERGQERMRKMAEARWHPKSKPAKKENVYWGLVAWATDNGRGFLVGLPCPKILEWAESRDALLAKMRERPDYVYNEGACRVVGREIEPLEDQIVGLETTITRLDYPPRLRVEHKFAPDPAAQLKVLRDVSSREMV